MPFWEISDNAEWFKIFTQVALEQWGTPAECGVRGNFADQQLYRASLWNDTNNQPDPSVVNNISAPQCTIVPLLLSYTSKVLISPVHPKIPNVNMYMIRIENSQLRLRLLRATTTCRCTYALSLLRSWCLRLLFFDLILCLFNRRF